MCQFIFYEIWDGLLDSNLNMNQTLDIQIEESDYVSILNKYHTDLYMVSQYMCFFVTQLPCTLVETEIISETKSFRFKKTRTKTINNI